MSKNVLYGALALGALALIVTYGDRRRHAEPAPLPTTISIPAPVQEPLDLRPVLLPPVVSTPVTVPIPLPRPKPKLEPVTVKPPLKIVPKAPTIAEAMKQEVEKPGFVKCAMIRSWVANTPREELEAMREKYNVSEEQIARYLACLK